MIKKNRIEPNFAYIGQKISLACWMKSEQLRLNLEPRAGGEWKPDQYSRRSSQPCNASLNHAKHRHVYAGHELARRKTVFYKRTGPVNANGFDIVIFGFFSQLSGCRTSTCTFAKTWYIRLNKITSAAMTKNQGPLKKSWIVSICKFYFRIFFINQ